MAYKTKNLNYAFYVEYYDDGVSRSDEVLKSKNRGLVSISCDDESFYYNDRCNFKLQTCYPGLLIGIGGDHSAGETSEIGLGFTFDYVTGMPYLPGSSLKGTLRSAFAHRDYICGLLRELGVNESEINVRALENEIFEGTYVTTSKDGKRRTDCLPLPKRDIFYDSFPVTKGKLMALEAITPHGNDLTKEPNPLTLLKVKPRVVFRFSFRLHDSVTYKAVTADIKRELFKQIIKDMGLGAKTNVGFGAFTDVSETERFEDTPDYAD